MSNVKHLPPFAKTVHVEADIPISQRDEFNQAMIGILAGERPRMEAIEQDQNARVHCPQHVAFLTTTVAYEKYVEYWNSKVNELEHQRGPNATAPY